nr:hypothetical protein [uncultured Mediterranean phage uvMED]
MCKICDQCDCFEADGGGVYVMTSIGVEANNKCNCTCDCTGCKDRRHNFSI